MYQTSMLYPFRKVIEYKIPYRIPPQENNVIVSDNLPNNQPIKEPCNDCGYYCDMIGGSICHECKLMCSKVGGTKCHYCKENYKLINGHYYHTCKDQKKIEEDIKNKSKLYTRYNRNTSSNISYMYRNLRRLHNSNLVRTQNIQRIRLPSLRNNNNNQNNNQNNNSN
jgi:hypothetical protein